MKILRDANSCFCVGPQKGQPLCPCRMRGVTIKNGRYVIPEQDLGPAKDTTAEGLAAWVEKTLADRD